MRPLTELTEEEARSLVGVVFDLDDTLLDHGALTEHAYGALFRLRASGLTLLACTGRPASWVHLAVQQWPIDGGIAENGAIAFEREGARIRRLDALSPSDRRARRERLFGVAEALMREHPSLAFTDDGGGRVADVTLDIGEHVQIPREEVRAIVSKALDLGVRTFVSSIHLHLTYDADDKGTAAIAACVRRGFDPTVARFRFAFIGDSGNDAAAFAAFHPSFGVRNVLPHVRHLSAPPRFLAAAERGAGFAEIAARLCALRS